VRRTWFAEGEWKGGERQRKKRWEKIKESRFIKWYEEVKREGISDYLKKSWEESRWKRVARYRLGNEMREDTGRKRREGDVNYVAQRGKSESMCGEV